MTVDSRPRPDAATGATCGEPLPVSHTVGYGCDLPRGHTDMHGVTTGENARFCWVSPAPPSAPASAGMPRGPYEGDYPGAQYANGIWQKGYTAGLDAAQRQHAAEVAQRAVDHVEVLKQAGQTIVAATAALEAAQQEGAKLRYELAFAAPQFHGKGEQMEGRWHCRVCGVFGQGYDTIKHRDTCPLYGYDYTTARSTLAATPPAPACPGYGYAHSTGISCAVCAPEEAAPPAEQEATGRMVLKSVSANIGGGTAATAAEYARYMRRQQTAAPQPPPADADALREALPERIRQELGGWLVHDPQCWHMTHGCDCGLDNAIAALAAPQPPAGENA